MKERDILDKVSRDKVGTCTTLEGGDVSITLGGAFAGVFRDFAAWNLNSGNAYELREEIDYGCYNPFAGLLYGGEDLGDVDTGFVTGTVHDDGIAFDDPSMDTCNLKSFDLTMISIVEDPEPGCEIRDDILQKMHRKLIEDCERELAAALGIPQKSEGFQNLSDDDQADLLDQQQHMKGYHKALVRRIKRLEILP